MLKIMFAFAVITLVVEEFKTKTFAPKTTLPSFKRDLRQILLS